MSDQKYEKKNLLFFFSDENAVSATAVSPTLFHLAESLDMDFESYICTTPKSHGGNMLPFTGNNHLESFYYLANFYKKIYYCSLTTQPGFQFRREVLSFGGEIVSCRSADEVAEFYKEVFNHFQRKLPDYAVILPTATNGMDLAPFCYPEILYRKALGVTQESWNTGKMARLGVKKAGKLYCHVDVGDLKSEQIDELVDGDTYGTITERITKRWITHAKGIGFGDASGIFRWNALFCRDNILCMYQPSDWKRYIPVVAKYAKETGNDVIIGNQCVVPMTDDVCTEFSKYGLVFNLIGVNPRVGFTIQRKHKLPLDWLADAKAPWHDEYSDEYLQKKIDEKAIPVCVLFYAADLGHLPVLPRILDLMGIEGMRAGIAFPSTWYEYQPELLEQLYIPRKAGGVFPQLEPMISSAGIAVTSECREFLLPQQLTDLLRRAKNQIADSVGKHMIPLGYYPFQDTDPYYQVNVGEPQYGAVAEAGFEYYFTYRDSGKAGHIVCEEKGMTVLNQQCKKWFPFLDSMQSIDFLKEWEGKIPGDESNWIVLSYDTPFFGVAPTYMCVFEGESYDLNFVRRFGMQTIVEAMQYVRKGGGASGRLFLLKPHELYRYAHLLRKGE